ncbi:Uncharacterized mitochondrial protein AtMg00310 [Linum perenne]
MFGKANRNEASKLKEVLTRYSVLSGQRVNEEKSALFFSKNTPDGVSQAVADILGVPREVKLGKYLGLPAEWGNSKSETFHFLLDRMVSKAGNWKSLLLSQGGKEVLAKSVLQAIPAYVFSCFMLPDTLLKKLDAVIAKFWWSGDVNRRAIHWCSKERLTDTKFNGGLGFRSFKEFNLAHLVKLCWRIIQNPGALWVRVLKALYFPRTDFVEASGHHRPSWIWGSIINGKEALLKGLRKNVGNGCDTFIDEAWFLGAEDFRFCPVRSPRCRIADFIVQSTRQWDRGKLSTMFGEEVVREIMKIPIGPPSMKDRWIWHHDTKGVFSIRSCYRLLKRRNGGWRGSNNQQTDWKWVWQLSLPPKASFFLWKVCANLIATRVNLKKRNCSPSDLCPCCLQMEESTQHLLFECEITRDVWKEVQPRLLLPNVPNGQQSVADWFKEMVKDGQIDRCRRAALCCWVVWKSRNELCFENIRPNLQGMVRRVFSEINLWERSMEQSSEERIGGGNGGGELMHQGQGNQMSGNPIKRFLCDGSFKGEIQKAGIGVIAVNPEGRIVDGVARRLLCRAPIVAEAYAVLTACKLATQERVMTEVWSDCKQVVQAC